MTTQLREEKFHLSLAKEAFIRSPEASRAFILLGLLTFGHHLYYNFNLPLSFVGLSVVVVNLVRLFLSKKANQQGLAADEIKKKFLLLKLLIRINSIIFSFFFFLILLTYPLLSATAITAVVIINGICAGASTSLAATPDEQTFLFRIILTLHGFSMIGFYIYNSESVYLTAGLAFIVGSFYFIKQSRIIRDLLFRNYNDKFDLEEEQIILKSTLDQLQLTQKALDSERMRSLNAERLASVGSFASGLAHEVNNPLAIASGQVFKLEKLFSKISDPEVVAQSKLAIGNLNKVNAKISEVIKGLRSFASEEVDNEAFEDTSLQTLLDISLLLLKEKIVNSGIEFKLALAPDVNLKIQKNRLAQALFHVIRNAFEAAQRTEHPQIEISFRTTSDKLEILIADSGPGISIANREKIFDPFFTTKDVGQGTGLGLSIARGIALSQNGDLYLDTEAVRTTFCFLLKR